MTTIASYPWPIPPGASTPPVWTDRGFVVDGKPTDVVSYDVGSSGWSDDLTSFSGETPAPITRLTSHRATMR